MTPLAWFVLGLAAGMLVALVSACFWLAFFAARVVNVQRRKLLARLIQRSANYQRGGRVTVGEP